MIERHMPSWVPEVVAIVASDQRFFDRRLDRKHRLRLAAPCEMEEARWKLQMVPPPKGARAFVAIRILKRGELNRVIGFAVDCGEIDFDEGAARLAYLRLQRQDVTNGHVIGGLWRAVPTWTGVSS